MFSMRLCLFSVRFLKGRPLSFFTFHDEGHPGFPFESGDIAY